MPPLNLYARGRLSCATSLRDRGCSAHPVFPAPSDIQGARAIGALRAPCVAGSYRHACHWVGNASRLCHNRSNEIVRVRDRLQSAVAAISKRREVSCPRFASRQRSGISRRPGGDAGRIGGAGRIRGKRLTRVWPDGASRWWRKSPAAPMARRLGPTAISTSATMAALAGSSRGTLMPGAPEPHEYIGGSIQRVDLATGKVETLFDTCGERPLKGPNDLVFDRHGGLWFTDLGKRRAPRHGRRRVLLS